MQAGSNIGIIKNPLGPNPQLVAATRPIPVGLTSDLVLSSDGHYLTASYPNGGGLYIFDVLEMIETIENPGAYLVDDLGRTSLGYPQFFNPDTAYPATKEDLQYFPIDDVNPLISVAADYKILEGDWLKNQFVYGVPENSPFSPIAVGGTPRGLATSPPDWLQLTGPGNTSSDLTPTFTWDFEIPDEDVLEVNLFVSTFDEGEGLLPWDEVVNLGAPDFLPNLSEAQKRSLLTNPWNGYDDFNPGRIVTATWKKETNTWYWHDGETVIAQPVNDPLNTNTRLTLPDLLMLTAGQNFYWSVQAIQSTGQTDIDFGKFQTLVPVRTSPFSSVTVLTHGFDPFTLLPGESLFQPTGISSSFYDLADHLVGVNGELPDERGLLLRYDKPTGL